MPSQKKIMIATKESFEPARVAPATRLSDDATRGIESEPHSSEQLPNSKRVYLPGQIHPNVRVPMREIAEYDGRVVKPQDNGYLSDKHARYASNAEKNRLVEFPRLKDQRRRPLRASNHAVTQLWYAREGIITPEMEFIAIRENMGISQ